MDQRCGRCKQIKDGNEFQPSYRRRTGTYCRPCCKAYRLGERIEVVHPTQSCLHCGKQFSPKLLRANGYNKYCSTQCSWDYQDAKVAAKRRLARLDRLCLHCGESIPETKQKGTVFCSQPCNKRAHMLKRALRNRRGLPINSQSETGYLRARLGVRDNWICGICNEEISPLIEYPDPLFASVDHIIPVAKGGSSDEENLRIVHLVCNLRKGNR